MIFPTINRSIRGSPVTSPKQVALNFALTEGQGAAIVGARNGRQALEMLGAQRLKHNVGRCGVDMANPFFSGFAMENHTSLIGTSSFVKNTWPNAIAALAMLPLYQTSIAMV